MPVMSPEEAYIEERISAAVRPINEEVKNLKETIRTLNNRLVWLTNRVKVM